MRVVLALGNPGSRYAATRHNIGWIIADALVERLRGTWVPGKGDYFESTLRWRSRPFMVVKPTTYMNLSGRAARQVLQRQNVDTADMLVVVDEIQFAPGRLGLKPGGSAGGHNGLRSLIDELGTDQFPRLRCGVGRDFGPGEMVDYVLAPFPSEQREVVEQMVARGVEAILTWIVEGTAATMNDVNRAASPGAEQP